MGFCWGALIVKKGIVSTSVIVRKSIVSMAQLQQL